MARLPVFARRSAQPNTFSDITDTITGTSFLQLFLATASPDSNVLTKTVVYSNEEVTASAQAADTTYATQNDIDFDIQLEVALKVKGTLIANIPVAVRGAAASNAIDSFSRVTVKLRKWDGTTETEIASNVGTERDFGTLGDNIPSGGRVDCIEVEVDSEVTFKAGEFLRITTVQEGKVSAGAGHWSFGHDPKNRDGATAASIVAKSGFTTGDVTEAFVLIPFRNKT